MKNADFIALITSNTNKTHNIRTYAGVWHTGASRVPDAITTKIGNVIALIQAKINQGLFCNKEKESLLVYNFQPFYLVGDNCLCSLEMVIKPLAKVSETKDNVGAPFQLAINGISGEVVNNTQGMISAGLITPPDFQI